MRRFLLAVAALLVVTATPALAGYLVIRVLLDGGGGGPAAAPGGPGFAGPGPGIRGGGEGGPGPGGPGGLGRGRCGGGTPGMPGPGMPGPGLGGQPGFTGAAEEHGDPSRSVVVVIPFEKLPGQKNFYKPGHGGQNPPWPFALDHPLGHTNLFTDGQTIQWYLDFVQVPERGKTKQSDIRARRTAWGRNPADAQPLLNLVNEALENGMVKEAVAYSDDLLAAFKADKRVTKFGEDPQRFVERYEKLRPRITGSAAPRPDADDWKRRLGATGLRHQGHYTLLSSGASDAEQTRRLTQLDDNFKAFFLWHLTRGIELNVPTVTQLAVLAPDSERVIPLARALDVLGAYSAADKVEKSEKSEKGEKPARALERLLMPADAFYAPDYDLLVLSPERLDSVGQTFRAQNQSIYREGFNRAELTGGGGPKLGPDPRNPLSPGRQPEDVARMQTLAAVEAYLQEEGELSAVSREGSHQLLYAAGLLPRHVSAPTWLVNGAADFFHRPKGPVFTTREDKLAAKDESKTFVTVALTTGYGVPNYVLHKHFKEMIARKELMTRGDPEALLRNVLSDAYYAALREGDELDAPPPPPPTTNLPRAGATTQPGYGPQPGLGGPGRSGSAPPTGEGGPGPGGKPQPPPVPADRTPHGRHTRPALARAVALRARRAAAHLRPVRSGRRVRTAVPRRCGGRGGGPR